MEPQSSLANIQDQKAFATIAQKLYSMKLCAEQRYAARKTRDQKQKAFFKDEEMSQPSHTSVAHLAVHADVR